MCGIVGLYGNHAAKPEKIGRALHALHHRGPNGQGQWFHPNGQVALGHTRLSIIGLTNGQQPLSNEDGTLTAIVNGEFYGFESIRNTLLTQGHRFKTESDSEILLHLYEEYGTDCVHHLRGEFAFALWDDANQQLICGRDRFGIKPFCYAQTANGLMFASEAKALLAMGHPAAWDTAALFQATHMQYTLPHQTLFQGIRQLPPGHLLIANTTGIHLHNYWDINFPAEPTPAIPEDDAIEHLQTLLTEAVTLRLRSDVPTCCHLSGGLDSSAIAGLMAQHGISKPHCFTVSFEADAYDEIAFARETAQHLGATLHEVQLTQSQLLNTLPTAVQQAEGLAINGHLAAKYLLNQQISAQNFKVALTGEGADELLAGYPHLRQDMLATQGQANDQLYATNTVLQGVQLPTGQTLSLATVQNQLGYVPTFLAAKASIGHRMQTYLSPSFLAPFHGNDAFANLLATTNIQSQLRSRHVVNQSSYLWTKTALATYILRTLGDGTEMPHSIEGRLPFLDHKLAEFLRTIPISLKIRNGVEKYLLRQATKPILTDTVYRRQKHSFMAPPLSLFNTPGACTQLADTFTSADFTRRTPFNGSQLTQLVTHLHTHTPADLTALEPVLMTALTSYYLASHYNLSL